jgi:hypothetical protein
MKGRELSRFLQCYFNKIDMMCNQDYLEGRHKLAKSVIMSINVIPYRTYHWATKFGYYPKKSTYFCPSIILDRINRDSHASMEL